MAHIRKTESGNYEVFIDIGIDPATGKRKQCTKTLGSISKEKFGIGLSIKILSK